jgi:phosphoglycerate dehydrogenase-like enzyme
MFFMKYNNIVCENFRGSELSADLWNRIDGLCAKRVNVKSIADLSARELGNADCLLLKLGASLSEQDIDQMPNLRYVGMLGTGYGGIDTISAANRGVTVTNIADYATEAVAEFSFGILLEQLRDIAAAKKQAQIGDYSDNFSGSEIKGKKFAVIGMGNIGARTAQLAQAFGAEVSYWSRNRKKDIEASGVQYGELDDLLASSDITTLNLALNPETEGIINTNRTELIKKDAIFINVSPMELVDFKALTARLKKQDMVFILDHSDEMTAAQLKTLQPLDNCLVYPAVAYLSGEASRLKQRIYVENLESFLAGNPTNTVS